jgi:hypothetical protein
MAAHGWSRGSGRGSGRDGGSHPKGRTSPTCLRWQIGWRRAGATHRAPANSTTSRHTGRLRTAHNVTVHSLPHNRLRSARPGLTSHGRWAAPGHFFLPFLPFFDFLPFLDIPTSSRGLCGSRLPDPSRRGRRRGSQRRQPGRSLTSLFHNGRQSRQTGGSCRSTGYGAVPNTDQTLLETRVHSLT